MMNSLIVGGTGMLKASSEYLVSVSNHSYITGRNESRREQFKAENVTTLPLDYAKAGFSEELQNQIEHPISTALLWLHSSGSNELLKLIEYLAGQANQCSIYHVLGSASYNPAKLTNPFKEKAQAYDNLTYNEVILGFQKDGNYSRWLSHEEIGLGAIQAIKNQAKKYTIGQTEPWSDRP